MKIGINATFLHEKPTGLGVFTKEVCCNILSQNKDTVIFSPIPIDGVSSSAIHRAPLAIKGSFRFRNNLYRAIYLNTTLPVKCRLENLDVLFCPMMEFPFIPLVPSVVHVHDLHPIQFSPQFKRAATFFRISLFFITKVVRRLTVPSNFVKKELLNAIDIDDGIVDVVPNGYNNELFIPQGLEMKRDFLRKYSLPENYILSVGNLFPYKNVKTLINAFLRIKDRIEHSLVIVGRKEFSPEPLPADERIFYMDYVSAEDLPKFYSYADMLIHPSLSEGFGLTPLEAMACGTPVISSNAGSLPEVVGNAGIFFDPRDVDYLSRLIEEVADNEAHRKELAERGLENAKRFSWEKTAEGILRSCEKALREK